MEDLRDFAHVLVRDLDDFTFLTLAFFRVVFRVALRGEVTAQSHRNRSGSNLGEPGGDNNAGGIDGARQAGSQSKRNSQSVGHSDDDVADGFTGGKVTFDVTSLWHISGCG